ncbi:MAG TPA: malto-oligosyltrehalose trehalohydrolase [Firmicutes bacterium]|nr:malto-oligosyltrehalose trehalohydrolase [Bacillota bacterium]
MKTMGAHIIDRKKWRVEFRVYAFNRKDVGLLLNHGGGKTELLPMEKEEPHIFRTETEGLRNIDYKFRLGNDGDFPDPFSHYQPDGVDGFSRVIDHEHYTWKNPGWQGKELAELIFYELHVGTFTPEGTFQGIMRKLDYLLELGVNAVELMPVAQTPGRWNWGYDGACLFSVEHNYGTPDDLKKLIDECHGKGIAVFLDVVYNHLGPEGNYLPLYGPYFTGKYETPWGEAVNFDDQHCEAARRLVLQNVRYWLEKYRFDGLRLDAVHAIYDTGPKNILQEIVETGRDIATAGKRKVALIAETDENDINIINPPAEGGTGFDAQWMDDFHHSIHTILTKEKQGYYIDYGPLQNLEKVYSNFLYTGQFSRFWQKNRGTDASENPGQQFVVSLQNHDQVGNRARGERLGTLVDFPFLKAAATLLFMAPYLPLLFMGEEYAEERPFLFFVDYQDPELRKNVSKSRREEFQSFDWGELADPVEESTFLLSKLTPPDEWGEKNKQMFAFYKEIISLRKTHPALRWPNKKATNIQVHAAERLVKIERWGKGVLLRGLCNLGEKEIDLNKYSGKHILNTEWKQYGGLVEGTSQVLYRGNMIILEER